MVLNIPRWLRLTTLGLTTLLHTGCYYMQAARGQLGVMRAREPIGKVLARPGTSDTLKQQLTRALRIREFASQELGLPDNKAYRR